MAGVKYMYGLLILVFLVGMVLRYGKSSDLLLGDVNTLIGTVTLQNPNLKYYGPQ